MIRLHMTSGLPIAASDGKRARWPLLAGLCAVAAATPAAAAPVFVTVPPTVTVDLVAAPEASLPIGDFSLPAMQADTIPPNIETSPEAVGPHLENDVPPDAIQWADSNDIPRRPYASFGEDVKAIKWETAAMFGYYTATNAPKLFKNPRWPTTQNEGWFGRDTNNVGVDKLAHAYSTYVISEILHARLKRKTGDAPGIEITSAILASGVMMWSEAFDSIEPTSGWSWQDVAFNSLGAGFSVLRNSVPGLDQKLAFRLLIQPNSDIYTINGKEHFRQQRYFFALKGSGFEGLNKTPLRFLELHLGYRGDDFLNEDRAAGITPKRHVFAGIGINLRELLFKNPRSRAGRAAGEVLDYLQVPYTALHHNLTE